MPYAGDPAASNRDAVYFLIGDTKTTAQEFTNAEIDFLLAQNGSNVYAAAAEAARQLAAKFAKQADKTVGDLSVSLSQKSKAYLELLRTLEEKAATQSYVPTPYAGGISRSDKENDETDADRVEPFFKRGRDDFTAALNTLRDDV